MTATPLPLWARALRRRATAKARASRPAPPIGAVVSSWRVSSLSDEYGSVFAVCTGCGRETERRVMALWLPCGHREGETGRQRGTAGVECVGCRRVGAVFEGPRCGRCWRRNLTGDRP